MRRAVPGVFLERSCSFGSSVVPLSLFHSSRTEQVMQSNVAIASGAIKSRERALRLVRRVAAAIDRSDELPTEEEIIQLCSTYTNRQCILPSFPSYIDFAS